MTNAYQVSIAARQLLEGYAAAWPGAWSRRTWQPSDAAWRASAGIYPK